jgi:hypothetical protein
LFKILAEDWSTFEEAVEVHERPPLIASYLVRILATAGYSNVEIRQAAATMTSFVD